MYVSMCNSVAIALTKSYIYNIYYIYILLYRYSSVLSHMSVEHS